MSHLRTALAALFVLASAAHAQLPTPRLNSIFPCGAKAGTTVDCTLTGGELQGATGLAFSHPGIKADLVKGSTFKVTLADDVPVGHYDVRVITPLGLSNFRAFLVSDWPEAAEKEPNNEPTQALRVTLPVIVNGKMDGSTDVDHFVFAAKKGQRVFINCWAWRIDSQLDGTMRVTDAHGKDVAYSGDYYGRDPFIDFTAPEDGDYTLKVWDFVYGGGNDYFYRIHIGSVPHLDAMVPAAVNPGKKTTVTIYGRNLPGGKPAPENMQVQGRPLEFVTRDIEVDAATATSLRAGEAFRPGQTSLDGMPLRLTTPEGSSNHLFVAYTPDPILLEKEPNGDMASAQRLPIPCDVTATFDKPGDVDVYAFTAKKGEKLVIEVVAERVLGFMDPFLVGLDSKGKKLVTGGVLGRNIGQIRFTTTTRDARWDFTPPADGEYFVQLRDLYHQQRGDARFVYRLCVRKPQPDFRLIVVPNAETQPDCTVVGKGGQSWMDVLVFRMDGFDEPITIEASDLPAGVSCAPVVVGPGKQSVPLVFRADATAEAGHGVVRVLGKALIDDKEVSRVARGGGLTWGTTNTPGLARLCDGIVLAVREAPPFSVASKLAHVTASAGEKVSIPVQVFRAKDWSDSVQFSSYDLPQGATVSLTTVPANSSEGKVELSLPANLKPGSYTFVLTGAGQVPREYGGASAAKTTGQRMRVVYPSNPITVTVSAAKK